MLVVVRERSDLRGEEVKKVMLMGVRKGSDLRNKEMKLVVVREG